MNGKVFDSILAQAQQQLSVTEQLRLAAALTNSAALSDRAVAHRITDLKGLGKAIWEGVDAEQYVEEERASWDG